MSHSPTKLRWSTSCSPLAPVAPTWGNLPTSIVSFHRRDAGYTAARIATFVRELATEMGPPPVATVGRLEMHPDLVNVVATRADGSQR